MQSSFDGNNTRIVAGNLPDVALFQNNIIFNNCYFQDIPCRANHRRAITQFIVTNHVRNTSGDIFHQILDISFVFISD